MIAPGFEATKRAIQQTISDLVDHYRFPRTANHRAEMDAIAAELVFWYGQLRDLEATAA
ncbi:MAG: hypothetical protein M3Y08_01190 [Fibrobacterota bacterium]|nr:hypothetical protein [Fibrobacterota bacterium]